MSDKSLLFSLSKGSSDHENNKKTLTALTAVGGATGPKIKQTNKTIIDLPRQRFGEVKFQNLGRTDRQAGRRTDTGRY